MLLVCGSASDASTGALGRAELEEWRRRAIGSHCGALEGPLESDQTKRSLDVRYLVNAVTRSRKILLARNSTTARNALVLLPRFVRRAWPRLSL
jgi:hypothetical protein